MANKKLAFQDIILTLQGFWSKQGANLMQAYDNEVGAGTMSPYTFLRSNGPEPWGTASCAAAVRRDGYSVEIKEDGGTLVYRLFTNY